MPPDINMAYQWAINTCNAPNIGYSQEHRNQETVSGITYYDCSSFIWYALIAGGFDCVTANGGSDWPFTTETMPTVLPQLGFQSTSLTGVWKPGDIGLSATHTEMVYTGGTGQGICMGAHTWDATIDNQVSIGSHSGDTSYVSPSSRWSSLWRYGEGATQGQKHTWIWEEGQNKYFGDPEQLRLGDDPRALNNAMCLLEFFFAKGWTLQAIAALMGNMQQESTLNPGLIEYAGSDGHGLVQWTPPENLYDVLDVLYSGHTDWYDGDKQCNAIWAEYEQSTGLHDWGIEGQWYATTQYNMTWEEWAHATMDPAYLAIAFMMDYERPNMANWDRLQHRKEYAQAWYDWLVLQDPTGGGGGQWTPVPDKKKKKSIWRWIRYW